MRDDARHQEMGPVPISGYRRYIGIDYSGAATADTPLRGLRAYLCEDDGEALEVLPGAGRVKYWTRRGLAQWLTDRLREDIPTAVGIDHSFSFPMQYFEAHGLRADWTAFLEDFERHWPTHEPRTSVQSVREGAQGHGAARAGSSRWRRLTDRRSPGAKSPFHFDVPGSVAKSTHAGLPWLLRLRRDVDRGVHFWPFDGWTPAPERSVVAEVYPSMWNETYPRADRGPDQHDAFSVAGWMRDSDRDGRLSDCYAPALSAAERAVARVEGWILGVR